MSMASLVQVHVCVALGVLSNSKPSPVGPFRMDIVPLPVEVADQLLPAREEVAEEVVSSSKSSVQMVV